MSLYPRLDAQKAINKAIKENKRITVICQDDRKTILDSITNLKGCALIKPSKDSEEITVWPPDQCIPITNRN